MVSRKPGAPMHAGTQPAAAARAPPGGEITPARAHCCRAGTKRTASTAVNAPPTTSSYSATGGGGHSHIIPMYVLLL